MRVGKEEKTERTKKYRPCLQKWRFRCV